DPRILMLELDRILPHPRVLSSDGGNHSKYGIRYLAVDSPTDIVWLSEAGSIGLSIGGAIGAAVGPPEPPVVVWCGDGGMMMGLGDLETAVRLELPLVVVVNNDAALGSEVNVLAELGLPTGLAEIAAPSFAAIAVAMGAEGLTVRTRADLA